MSLVTEELRGWVGREVTYVAPEPIGRAAIRYFALAIGDDNPLYRDPTVAGSCGHPDVIAPPTYVVESNQYADGAVSDEGYVGHRWALPLDGFREVRGGHEYEFGRPVHPSDRLHVTWRIVGIEEKTSSSGVPMVVVTSEAEYRADDGEFLARNRETIIYQPRERP